MLTSCCPKAKRFVDKKTTSGKNLMKLQNRKIKIISGTEGEIKVMGAEL